MRCRDERCRDENSHKSVMDLALTCGEWQSVPPVGQSGSIYLLIDLSPQLGVNKVRRRKRKQNEKEEKEE